MTNPEAALLVIEEGMSKRRKHQRSTTHENEISWERLRHVFDDPGPPRLVWELQFDGFNEELRKLAITPWEKITPLQLSYYIDDLAYVDLQPELFNYLFPVCLMEWHQTLMRNEGYGGGSCFHYSLHMGQILSKMLTTDRLAEVLRFFHDSFLCRLDQERYATETADSHQLHSWLYRFNSLGLVLPDIAPIWKDWWAFTTPGRAIAGTIYLSGLMYLEGEHPFIPARTPERGGGGPYMDENTTSLFHVGWKTDNLQFLRQQLSVDFFCEKTHLAESVLQGQPEVRWVEKMLQDLSERLDLIECYIPWLIERLGRSMLDIMADE